VRIANKIRESLGAFGTRKSFSVADVQNSTGLTYHQVQSAFRNFLRRGEIARVKLGQYRRLPGDFQPNRPADLKKRLFRAMNARGVFSASDIARLADATVNYAARVIRNLVADGDLEQAGRRKNLNGYHEDIYRVRHSEDFFNKRVLPR